MGGVGEAFHNVDFALWGQPTVSMLVPSIQKAGQMPCPAGNLMLADVVPYA